MQLRQQILNSPSDLLPLPLEALEKLASMRFKTVRETFRAVLAGRLTARHPEQLALENTILETSCELLGHPVVDREALLNFQPGPEAQTIADAVALLNGNPFTAPESILAASIRDLLLPTPLHQAMEKLEAVTIGQMLALPLAQLPTAAINDRNLGPFIVHIFDFLLVVNDPASGAPLPDLDKIDKNYTVLLHLAPWFTMAALREGQELLDQNSITHILVRQNAVAGILIENRKYKQAMLRFADSPRSASGFIVDRVKCRHCEPPEGGRSSCRHAAALALAMLKPDATRAKMLWPTPFRFNESPWQLAADILNDLYGANPPSDIVIHRDNDHWHLIADTDFRSVSWRLNNRQMVECAALFGGQLPKKEQPKATAVAKHLRKLHGNLYKLAAANSEPDEDQTTPDADKKHSPNFWDWLAASFFLSMQAPRFSLEGPADNTLFNLNTYDDGDRIFSLALPRARTPDVLDGLCRLGLAGPAKELSALTRATLDDNSDLQIESCLRCEDGTIISRTEIEPNRYGRYYYLEDQGFIAVKEQESDNILSESTLDVTTIAADNVPEFVESRRHALDAQENIIQPDLRNLTIQKMPSSLNITQGRIHDDWCYLSGSYGFGESSISLEDLLLARKQGKKFANAADKWMKLDEGPLSWLHELNDDRIWNDEDGAPKGVRLSRPELLMLSSIIGEVKTAPDDKGEANPFASLLDTEAWQNPRQLPHIPPHLREYQRNGLAWLFNLYQYRLGGILADDMGLGKTHQALALLQAVQTERDNNFRFLVLCPATVVSHWVNKTASFYPELDYHVYHGPRRNLAEAHNHKMIITTYGIIRRDIELLAKLDFDLIVLDEVQHLKNKKTAMYKAAARLNGRLLIGLTGTPLENSTNDLKAIFDLCMPGLLGTDSTFNKQYSIPIEEKNDKEQRDRLSRLIQPFLLRRTKPQVLTELPDVIEDIRTCELSDDQVALYREIVEQRGRALISELSESPEKKPAYMEVLAVISYLKQICDHPALLANADHKRTYRSGKWDLFVELLNECLAANMKVVVFSHYTRMLDIIENHLDRSKIDYCSLRGSMPLKKRQNMIDRFNNDPESKVFCASLLAGGVGVDLTAAQAVIHYDRWWNAAREDQATSRVHRMGQRHVVQTFKLITVGTLEEKIHQIIEQKRNLAQHLVQEDDDAVIKRLSRDELMELLQWDNHL